MVAELLADLRQAGVGAWQVQGVRLASWQDQERRFHEWVVRNLGRTDIQDPADLRKVSE